MPGSPAAALVPAPRHTQWPRNQTSHEHAACCVGVTLHRMRVKGIRWGRVAVGRAVASGLCAKYGRPLEVPCGERPRRGRERPMKCASPQPARWTRLSSSNRLRSRSSPPDEDRGRPSPRSRRRHRPPRRPPPAPAARPRPPAPGYSPALHGPPTGKHEAGRRATPARPRAPNPSRRNGQRPRCRPPRPGAASSPRRARPQSAPVPAAPMLAYLNFSSLN